MVLWKKKHDPYVKVSPASSSAFLPILFHPPGSALSIHIGVYLPTMGLENQFMEELAKLSVVVEELSDANPNAVIFLRGDFNVSKKNKKRTDLLNHFCYNLRLLQTEVPKPTYHHFQGGGSSDSFLDRILFSDTATHGEVISSIECKLTNPLVNSHHDIISSDFFIQVEVPTSESSENIVNIDAPKVVNERLKVLWSDPGIKDYQDLVIPQLSRLQSLWLPSSTSSSVALLLSSTNKILTSCAAMTNKTISLSQPPSASSASVPKPVRTSQKALLKQNKEYRKALQANPTVDCKRIKNLKNAYNKARTDHRKLERAHKAKASVKRDEELYSIISGDSSSLFSSVKRSKRSKAGKLSKLHVGDKTYHGDSVKDGFYDSISNLKSRDWDTLDASEQLSEFSLDYLNILEVCKSGASIPDISKKDSFEPLQRLKPQVNDVYGVTANHYNHAGPAGWKHFHLLLSCLLRDVNNTSIEEVNVVYACILFKGHGKEKSVDRSYRTISTCPVVAKALDLYVRDLNIVKWNKVQAETQFQGRGSCCSAHGNYPALSILP